MLELELWNSKYIKIYFLTTACTFLTIWAWWNLIRLGKSWDGKVNRCSASIILREPTTHSSHRGNTALDINAVQRAHWNRKDEIREVAREEGLRH
jgi:hypothetical protein